MGYKIKLKETKLNILSLDTYNFLQKEVSEFIDFSNETEYEVAIVFDSLLSGMVKGLNASETNGKNYLELESIAAIGRKSYWFIVNKIWNKNLSSPILEIKLDVIATYGKTINSELTGKSVFYRRKHCERFLPGDTNEKIKIAPTEDTKWFSRREFENVIVENKYEKLDLKNYFWEENEEKKLLYGILNFDPTLGVDTGSFFRVAKPSYISSGFKEDDTVITNVEDIKTYTSPSNYMVLDIADKYVAEADITVRNDNGNHFTKYTDGSLVNIIYSPVPMYKKGEDFKITTLYEYKGTTNSSGVTTYANVRSYKINAYGWAIGATTAQHEEEVPIYIISQGQVHKLENLTPFKYDIKLEDEGVLFLAWSWKYELKIYNENNFRTQLFFGGITERFTFNTEKIVLDNFEINFKIQLVLDQAQGGLIIWNNATNPYYVLNLNTTYPINTNQYDEYIKRNKYTVATTDYQLKKQEEIAKENARFSLGSSIFGGITSLIGGAVGGKALAGSIGGGSSIAAGAAFGAGSAITGITGSVINYNQTMETASFQRDKLNASYKDMKVQNNSTSGGGIDSHTIKDRITGEPIIELQFYNSPEEVLQEQAFYFHKYGYEINGEFLYNDDNNFVREYFNFLELQDLFKYLNSFDTDIANEISRRFELGIRFWELDNLFGSYNLENWEKKLVDVPGIKYRLEG